MNLPTIQSFWIGPDLSNVEKLCIQSFLDHGHEFHLYTYADIAGVPAGAVVKDGNDILPGAKIFRDAKKGSLGAFSDWWRWAMLHAQGGWYVDMDVVCLRPFDFDEEIVVAACGDGYQPATIRFPAAHPFCAHMVLRCDKVNRIFAEDPLRVRVRKIKRRLKGWGREYAKWGETGGPAGFTLAAKRYDVARFAKSSETFFPDYAILTDDSGEENPARWLKVLLQDAGGDVASLFPGSYSFHIYNEYLRSAGVDKNAVYPAESLFEQLKRKHGVG